tara:strand:- start:70 stop:780 length:711 start_codon:yes stop_codon:yes gene_type:complete
MEAIVLVGGLGSRLGSLTRNTPKPLLQVRDKPFLHYLLNDLKHKKIEKVILATGFLSSKIENYFKTNEENFPIIEFSIEKEPLGTGGAILKALKKCIQDNVFIFNGDSYIDANLRELHNIHNSKNADISLVSSYLKAAKRYGTIEFAENNKIVKFIEKGSSSGYINAGIYIARSKNLIEKLNKIESNTFSFEKEILEKQVQDLKIFHYPVESFFLDIGIPEDFKIAQESLFMKSIY